jgi:hypothetical protein
VTLSDGITTVTLSAHLQWVDETWAPVVQSVHRCFGGSVAAQVAQPLLSGRPITLRGATDRGWLDASADGDDDDRTVLSTLEGWLAVPGQTLTLSGLRDLADQTVIFRHEAPPALRRDPIDTDSDHRRARYWAVELRLRITS